MPRMGRRSQPPRQAADRRFPFWGGDQLGVEWIKDWAGDFGNQDPLGRSNSRNGPDLLILRACPLLVHHRQGLIHPLSRVHEPRTRRTTKAAAEAEAPPGGGTGLASGHQRGAGRLIPDPAWHGQYNVLAVIGVCEYHQY